MFHDMKSFILEQDHASAHNSDLPESWCQTNFPCFWNKKDAHPKLDDFWPIERLGEF